MFLLTLCRGRRMPQERRGAGAGAAPAGGQPAAGSS